MNGERDVTALAAARWRKRCAVQAANDALTELRVANRLLAKAEGRPLRPRRRTEQNLSSGGSHAAPSTLAAADLPPAAAPSDQPVRTAGDFPMPAAAAEGPAQGRSTLSTADCAGPESDQP